MPKSMAMRQQVGLASENNPYANEGGIDIQADAGNMRSSLVGAEIRKEMSETLKDKAGAYLEEKMGITETVTTEEGLPEPKISDYFSDGT